MKINTRIFLYLLIAGGGFVFWVTDMGVREGFAVEKETRPMVVIATPMVNMDLQGAKVYLYGTGFKAGQKIVLLITTIDGVRTDIGSTLGPPPIANSEGHWVTSWNWDRYVQIKIIIAGIYTISVTDDEYNVIAQVPVAFYSEKKK